MQTQFSKGELARLVRVEFHIPWVSFAPALLNRARPIGEKKICLYGGRTIEEVSNADNITFFIMCSFPPPSTISTVGRAWESHGKSRNRARERGENRNWITWTRRRKRHPKNSSVGEEMKMFCERIMLIFSFFMRFTDAGWLSRVVFHREMWKICLLMGQLEQCCGFRALWTRLVVNIWVELWIILSCSCCSLL